MQQCNRHFHISFLDEDEKALFKLISATAQQADFCTIPWILDLEKVLYFGCNNAAGIFTYSFWMKIKKRFISYLMQLRNKQFFTHGVKNESKKRFLGWCNNATGIFSHDTLNFVFLKKRFFGWCNNATGRFSYDTLNFGFGEKHFFLGATVQQAFSHTHSGWR